MKNKIAQVQQKKIELTKPSCMLKPKLEAFFHVETTRSNRLLSAYMLDYTASRAGISQFLSLFIGIILDTFASILCLK